MADQIERQQSNRNYRGTQKDRASVLCQSTFFDGQVIEFVEWQPGSVSVVPRKLEPRVLPGFLFLGYRARAAFWFWIGASDMIALLLESGQCPSE